MKAIKQTLSLVLACAVYLSILLAVELPVMAAYENTHTNTGNQRVDIIEVAKTQLGYTEGSNNYTKYGAAYGNANSQWCAYFVSWCARQAGIPTSVIRDSANAAPNASVYTNTVRGHFGIPYYDGSSYTPCSGDLFFKKDFGHVGLVYYIEGSYFYTIEGNSNSSGSNDGTSVVVNKRRIKDFYFGVPNYNDVAHVVDTSYGTNFTAYPKAKITAGNIFNANHSQIDSTSWIGTSDKCTIHEVYTDGCCRVTYPLDAGGTKTVYSKISLFNTHTHSYTGVRVYENAHPHRFSQRCVDYASCGGWIWTDEYKELKTCEQCWHADFHIGASSISVKVGESKTVSASLSGCLPDTAVMSRAFSPDNDVVEVTVSNQQMTFTGLRAGTTNLSFTVYSDSSKSRILGTVTIPVTVISTHTHSYTGVRVYENAHPHRISQRCVDYASCGGWIWTDEYKELKTCEQCWHADFDIETSSVSVKVGESKTVAVSVSGCLPDSAVALPSFSPDNEVAEVTIKDQQATFTGLKEGTALFQIRIYSDSSKSYLIGATSIRVDVATPTYACEAGNHSYSYEEVPPTASRYGKLYGTCSLCGHKVSVALPALNTEDYVLTVLKEATCSEDGHGYYTWKTTTYGEYNYSAVIPATGHAYFSYVTEPDCTSNGYTTYVCLLCLLSYKDNHTKALGHTYVNGVCIRCDVEDPAGSGMGLIGDITGDGNVNMGDVGKLYAYVKGTSVTVDKDMIDLYDITGDGNVNMGDVGKLYAYIRGTSKL